MLGLIGLLIICFIGKVFYGLAKSHHKNEWLYAKQFTKSISNVGNDNILNDEFTN